MILVVNGPNLNLLGEREPEVYGRTTLAEIEQLVRDACAAWDVEVKTFQSNHEGAIIDFLHEHRKRARGVIINPGALAHTSYALHDALKAIPAATVEVHISNIHAREPFRDRSLVSAATRGQIVGLGIRGYLLAAEWLCAEIGATPREEKTEKRGH
jgi:3-dehydroquinate dehydratase-2